jgi:hypothetical protein
LTNGIFELMEGRIYYRDNCKNKETYPLLKLKRNLAGITSLMKLN